MSNIDDITLLDSAAEEVRLGDLWSKGPVALVFLRHYGCIFCRQHVSQLKLFEDQIRASGGKVVAVGMGTPAHAAAFKDEEDVPFQLLVDNQRQLYRAVGIKRGSWGEVIGPQNIVKAVKAFRSGARQGAYKQDPRQLGGAAVIAPGGEISWRYVSQTSSDNVPAEEIIDHLARA